MSDQNENSVDSLTPAALVIFKKDGSFTTLGELPSNIMICDITEKSDSEPDTPYPDDCAFYQAESTTGSLSEKSDNLKEGGLSKSQAGTLNQ